MAVRFEEGREAFRRQVWPRGPVGGAVHATAGPSGAKVWVKTGHLRFVGAPQVA